MKKSILHIKLMHWPMARDRKRQNCSDSSRLHNGTESLIIVDAGTLSESSKNPTCFVALKRTISLELVFEHPFACNHVGSRWTVNEIPSVVGKKCRELLHSRAPIGIGKCDAVGPRDG